MSDYIKILEEHINKMRQLDLESEVLGNAFGIVFADLHKIGPVGPGGVRIANKEITKLFVGKTQSEQIKVVLASLGVLMEANTNFSLALTEYCALNPQPEPPIY